MSATEVGNDLSKLWDAASLEAVTVESAGKPVAIVLSPDEYTLLKAQQKRREAGCGRHLLSGAGINVDEMLAIPIEDEFSEHI